MSFPSVGRIFILAILPLMLTACPSRVYSRDPVAPVPQLQDTQTVGQSMENRYLWAFYLGFYDPEAGTIEMVPVRDVLNHWNVLRFLEQGPCTDCVKIVGLTPSGHGTMLADVEITHPFQTLNLTGFDVRGICIFNSGYTFTESGLTTPDSASGGGEVMNADGYTTLYNGTTAGSGPGGLQGYLKGRFGSVTVPDAQLNGFRRFYSDYPWNSRHAFYAGEKVTKTFEVVLPSAPMVFGYAVDASWVPPTVEPVTDPQSDFPPEANCPEPFNVTWYETPVGDGLTDQGGQTLLSIFVADRQGQTSHSPPGVECAELFDGTLTALWVEDGPGWSRYDLGIENDKLASAGEYKCLISVEDNENASAPDWLDLTAYQICKLAVTSAQPDHHELWYYHSINLLPDQSLQNAIDMLQTAKDAGYEKVVLADFKLGTIDIQSETYWQHVLDYVAAAESVGIEIIPSLVPIGYSNAVLCHDPNLIEGQPVQDCAFRVSGTTASVEQDPSAVIVNGNFETHAGDVFDGWIQMDRAGVSTFADSSIKHSGSTSIRFEDFRTGSEHGNDRIRQAVTVKPWNCYAVTFWVRTENLSPADGFNVIVFDEEFDKNLQFLSYDVTANQDWRQYRTIFNSQDNTFVNIYFGMWSGDSGRFWMDDITIENTGLINLIRRDGCPFTLTDETGTVTYIEGVDFEYVEDPLMGHAGSYTGTFDLYHEAPVIHLTPGSSIEDGDLLLVDYYHCTFVYDLQTACCLTHDDVFDIFEATLSKVDELIHPSEVFIAVDELRVVNWCELCQSQGETPGQLLADATTRVDQIAHEINPSWKLIVWSDMYDPNHNAHDDYYLSNGTLADSWEGLPVSWDIGNWYRRRIPTLEWFADRGHRQILCGYYDESGPPWGITEWLDMSNDYDGVYACMYTTWWKGYDDLESWAQAVRDWDEENW